MKYPLYGLTLRHPWPAAMIYLGKRIENRAYPPSRSPQQPRRLELDRNPFYVALHGGLNPYEVKNKADREERVFEYEDDMAYLHEHFPETLAYGDLIVPGVFAVAGIHGARVIQGPKNASSDFWYSGPFGWPLERMRVLAHTIPARGGPGLWEISDGANMELYAKIQEAYPHARAV